MGWSYIKVKQDEICIQIGALKEELLGRLKERDIIQDARWKRQQWKVRQLYREGVQEEIGIFFLHHSEHVVWADEHWVDWEWRYWMSK